MMLDFKNYLASLESNEEGNKNMVSFTNTLSGKQSKEELIKTATYDTNVIVILGDDVENNAVLILSFKNLGGHCDAQQIRLLPSYEWVLCSPTGVQITNDNMCQHEKHKVPGLKKLQKYQSSEERAALTGFDKELHHGANVFIPAHWLVQSLNNAGTIEPLTRIPQILDDPELYDKEHAPCDKSYHRAQDHTETAANFL